MKIILESFLKYKSLLIVLIFAILGVFPLLHSGFIPTHDGEYHIIRFYEFDKTLRDGNLYPRWAPDLNNGFGIPLFNFVYPLPNYIASLLHVFGVSFIDSFKLSMFMATIMGAIFFYLWSKEFWGEFGGIVSSIFYTFSPYHFLDIYIRGSVGEVWALGLFPVFLWLYTKFAKTRRSILLLFSSLTLALIIFSHNILALMFFAFILVYAIFTILNQKKKMNLMLSTISIIFGSLGASAIFWLPAILESKYVVGLQIFDVTAHFPELYQLLIPSWGSGFSGAGLQNELSYQIGLANLLAVFLSMIVIIVQIKRKNKNLPYTIFFLVCFILTSFLMLNISLPIWKTIPLMNYFQFPWRLLSVDIIFASFLAGSIFSLNIKKKWLKIPIGLILIFTSFSLGIGYAKPAYYFDRNDDYYMKRSNFIDGTNSPGNVFHTKYLTSIPPKEKEKIVYVEGSGGIILKEAKSNYYNFTIQSDVSSEIQANLAYFPGWEVYLNGKMISLAPSENGRFSFLVSKGIIDAEIIFNNTFVRKIATIISLVTLILVVTLLVVKRFATIKR